MSADRVLTLPLQRLYFNQINWGTKEFEYRLTTDYWRKRIEGREYDRIVLTLGYPPAADTKRRIERPWRGYEVQTLTHPHFGEEPVEVFAIRVNKWLPEFIPTVHEGRSAWVGTVDSADGGAY